MRVVECASSIASPSCALHLQQLGAQVIRIDPIGGGPDFHRWPVSATGSSLYWEGLNKGKQSVAVNFSRNEGRSLVAQLICAPGDARQASALGFGGKLAIHPKQVAAIRAGLLPDAESLH